MKRNTPGLLLAMALIVAACSGSAEPDQSTTASTVAAPSSTSSTATTPPTTSPPTTTTSTSVGVAEVRFDRGRCPFSVPVGTDPECGTVSVPQDRSNPDGLEVELAVAVFGATIEEQLPPIVYLEGGPGGEALSALEFSYTERFAVLNQHRTVVFFDQRGIGHSEPALDCPEIGETVVDLLDDVIDTPAVIERQLAALQPCRDRWAASGVVLEHYNSAASAQDVADIRRALEIDEWDLFGVSYGTRLALTIMRDAPAGVRAVILDSTYPPEVNGVASIPSTADRALNELYGACASSETCTDTYGDLEALLFAVIDQLDASPAEVVVTDLFTAEQHVALIDGDSLLGLIFQSLYSERLFPSVPEMLLDAQNGRYTLMERLLSLELANLEFLAIGQNFSVQCHEEVPYADPDAVVAASEAFPRLAGLVDGAFTQSVYAFEFCPTWGAGVGDPIEALAVDSDIPTLVVAGQFDPITPPSFGEQVAARLTNAFFIEYPGLGAWSGSDRGMPDLRDARLPRGSGRRARFQLHRPHAAARLHRLCAQLRNACARTA